MEPNSEVWPGRPKQGEEHIAPKAASAPTTPQRPGQFAAGLHASDMPATDPGNREPPGRRGG